MAEDTTTRSTGAGGHALVIGGSMAGLLAARVLADHFARVTILERDRLPETPAPRKGVPQARHNHILLMRGKHILEALFPGLQDELIESGAVLLDAARDLAWLSPAGWGVRFPSSLTMLALSRDLLEWSVRRRLAACAPVAFVDACTVQGLLLDARGAAVTGVRATGRGEPQQSDGRFHADLVVDAGGRGSKMPQWLEAAGYPPPLETVVNAHLGYSSRIYAVPPGSRAWKALYLQSAPPAMPRAGVILPIEGDRWHVSLGGGGGDYPPTEASLLLDFARSLRSPALYEAIREAEALSPVSATRATTNQLRHYERLSRYPERLVVLGDAVCAFNPVYGQGMTTAALGALTLQACLQKQRRRGVHGDLQGLGRRFQKRLAKVNTLPWMLATSEDYRYSGTTGGRADARTRLMHAYMDQVMRLSTELPEVRRRLLEVFHMLRPPSALFHPTILRPAVRSFLTHRKAGYAEADAPGPAPSTDERAAQKPPEEPRQNARTVPAP